MFIQLCKMLFIYPHHNGPGDVGNKTPVIAAAIHTTKAITNALIQPILYRAFKVKSQTNPPAMAAQNPFPRRKYAMLYTIEPIRAVIIAVLKPSFSPNNFVTMYIITLEMITPITNTMKPYIGSAKPQLMVDISLHKGN
jgi:hypothetical protein